MRPAAATQALQLPLAVLVGHNANGQSLLASSGDLKGLKATRLALGGEVDQEGYTLLHHAARNGHLPVVQYLIEMGVDLDATNSQGNTALHLAVMAEQVEVVDFLLASGADHTILNSDQDTPLHLAVSGGNTDLLKVFVSRDNIDLLVCNAQKQTVLHMVADHKLVEQARILVNCESFRRSAVEDLRSHDYILSSTDEYGLTPLHLASWKGSHQVLDMILTACKSLGISTKQMLHDSLDNGGATPLMAAVESGNTEVTVVLLQHGASPLTADPQGGPSPFHVACLQGRLEVVRVVVEHCGGGVLSQKDGMGKTPLHYCAMAVGDKCDVLSYMLSTEEVKVDEVDPSGQTPLHDAVALGNLVALRMLMAHEASPLTRNHQLQNVLHLAVANDQFNMLKHLLQLPGVPGLRVELDSMGDTPFHLAIKEDMVGFCRVMLECGPLEDIRDANGNHTLHMVAARGNVRLLGKLMVKYPSYLNTLNDINKHGESPLHLAAKGGHVDCVRLLLNRGATPRWCHAGKIALFHACSHGHLACVKVLLDHFPYQRDSSNSKGNTALHYATGSLVVRFLLDRGCKISLNGDSKSFLELAVERGHVATVKAALSHERWQESIDCNSSERPHPMLQFIHRMPEAAQLVLDRSYSRASIDKSNPEFWERFDFKYLRLRSDTASQVSTTPTADKEASNAGIGPKRKAASMRVMLEMMELGLVNLWNHPVANVYVKLKWNRYGIMYLLVFVLRVILASLVSIYALYPAQSSTLASGNGSNESDNSLQGGGEDTDPGVTVASRVIQVVALVLNLGLFLCLLLPLVSIGFFNVKLVTNGPLLFYTAAIVANFVFLFAPNPRSILPAGAIACFLSWVMVFVAMGFFEVFGVYVLRITRTVSFILVLSLLLITALSFSFHILVDTVEDFSTERYSFMTVFFHMLGEYQLETLISRDINGMLGNSHLQVFIFLFISAILLSIVMANAVIGLAVGDIEKIKENASFQKRAIQVNYFSHIDLIPFLRHHSM